MSHHENPLSFGLRSRLELVCSGCLVLAISLGGVACSSDASSDPDDGSGGKSVGGGGSSAGGATSAGGSKNQGGGGSSAGSPGSAGHGNGGGAGAVGQAGSSAGGASGTAGASGSSGAGGAGGNGAQSVDACLDSVTKLPTSSQVERMRFSGPGVEVGVLRYAGSDPGLGVSWQPLAFALVHGTEQACVKADLKYTPSRHNFNDFLNAPAPSGATWVFNQQANEGFVDYKFTVQEKQGTTSVWGPLVLKIEACRDLVAKKDCDYSK